MDAAHTRARRGNTVSARMRPGLLVRVGRLALLALGLGTGLAQAQLPPPLLDVPGAAPISLQFHNAEVRALMQVFAEFTGLNFVTTDSVTGQVSLRLQDVPWPQALQIVLQAKGLVARQDGRVVWVAPQDEWLAREKKRLEAQSALDQASPQQMLALRLRYARAGDIAQRLLGGGTGHAGEAAGGRWLTARGSVMAEPRTNQLFVSDVPARLAELQKIVERLDVPVRQVLIEARIVEADDQFGQALGVRLGLGAGRHVSVGGVPTSLGQLGAGNVPNGPGALAGNAVNFPAGDAGQKLVSPASLAVSVFNAAADRFINLELSALEADGRGKVVSRPRVITADQTKALIEQGTELPYQTVLSAGGSNLTNIQFRKANLKLEVTPQITPEGAVVLEVDVNRDSVGQLTAAGFAINTKHVKTQVRVADGGTVVLGGIFEDSDKNDDAKVPLLGDVPVFGWLFRNRQQLRKRSELLIFLTPRVLADEADGSEPVGPPTPRAEARP